MLKVTGIKLGIHSNDEQIEEIGVIYTILVLDTKDDQIYAIIGASCETNVFDIQTDHTLGVLTVGGIDSLERMAILFGIDKQSLSDIVDTADWDNVHATIQQCKSIILSAGGKHES